MKKAGLSAWMRLQEEEITGYLLNQLEAGNINEEGIDTILQALNLAG